MGFSGAGGEGEDVGDGGGGVAFAEEDGFFEGELVEGVHGHFDAGGFDGGVCCVDARFDLVVLVREVGCDRGCSGGTWRSRGRERE